MKSRMNDVNKNPLEKKLNKKSATATTHNTPLQNKKHSCTVCLKQTSKQCGVCKSVYYCSRECQIFRLE